MRYEEYNKQLGDLHKEYTKLYEAGNKDEANKIWRAFHDNIDKSKMEFRNKEKAVADRVYKDLGYKLSKAQEKAVKDLIENMYKAKLGKDYLNNNYEKWGNNPDTTEFCFSNWDKGIYLVRMNTKTLEKIQSLGIVEVVKVGGNNSDHIKPNFDFKLTEDERA